MPYFLFSPPGFLKEVYKAYLLFSKLTCVFPLLRFSHMSYQRDKSIYVAPFCPYFPTGFKWVLTTYATNYSPHIFPTGFLEELFKMINYKQRAFQRSMSHYTRRRCTRGGVRNWQTYVKAVRTVTSLCPYGRLASSLCRWPLKAPLQLVYISNWSMKRTLDSFSLWLSTFHL